MNIIVAHPFQQHSFKTANALKSEGNLFKYVTTVYLKKGTLTYFLAQKVLKGDNLKRVSGRKTEALDDIEVVTLSEWANLILLALQRINKKYYDAWYWKTIDIFNHKLFRYVKNSKVDAVIVYDTVSSRFIELVKKAGLDVKIIIDMSAPNALYMRHVFQKEAKEMKDDTDFQYVESDYFLRKCLAAQNEIEQADAFLVASSFTKESLEWSNVESSKIFKCTYGVFEKEGEGFKKDIKIIRCCFVGKVSLEKGAYRFFEMIDRIHREDMEFHFYGAYERNSSYYRKYHRRCVFHGHIPHIMMLEEFEKTDIIIFPSFADGFGFSVTEALLRGNIAICSKNAGVSELIVDGVNGFTYEPGKEEEKVIRFLDGIDRRKLTEMQGNASQSLNGYTWDKYNQQVNDAVNHIVAEELLS